MSCARRAQSPAASHQFNQNTNMKQRITISLAAIALVGTAFAILPVKSKPPTEPLTTQPLTYANVVSHFKAAHLRTTEVQTRCTIFFEGEWKNRDVYNYGLIIVENSDEDVQVTFYLTDAHEMNWLTEFIDAPYFTHSETQALFDLMNSGHDAKGQQIGRFRRVDFHHWKPRHADIFVFSLTPWQPGR
jgi:hypothetical protein